MHIKKNYILICLIILLLILIIYTILNLLKNLEKFKENPKKVKFENRTTFIKIPRSGKMKHYRDIDQNAKLQKLEEKQRDLINKRNMLLNEKKQVENRVKNINSKLNQNGEYYNKQLSDIFNL